MIYTEITPNPATLKFVTGKILMPTGSAEYLNISETEDAPLAKLLFDFKFVQSVFISGTFVSVTKVQDFSWEELIPQLKKSISDFLDTGKKAVENVALPGEESAPVDEDEVVKKIKKLLDESIRPAVAMDGGDVIFDSFNEGKVLLKLQGACSGCPSSTMTLKMGIEGLLTRMIPEVKEVDAVS